MSADHTNPHPEPVMVASYPDHGEAEVTKAHLAANGIEAFILDEIEGGALNSSGQGVGVFVHAQDADDARAVLTPAAES